MKRNIRMKYFKLLCLVLMLCSCSKETLCIDTPIEVKLSCTRSRIPDENAIWDINIFAYNEYESLADHKFISFSQGQKDRASFNLHLLKGCRYRFFVIANAGFDIKGMEYDKIMDFRLFLSTPDGNLRGMPMSCMTEDFISVTEGKVEMELVRMMSKVSIEVDKSGLDSGVKMNIIGARIGNCPRWANAFRTSHIEQDADCFAEGFSSALSEKTDLYLLENCNEDAGDSRMCSYVEMEFDYQSATHHTDGQKGVRYRFHIKDGNRPAVIRNSHYHVRVSLKGDGLSGNDSWRVDRTDLIQSESKP